MRVQVAVWNGDGSERTSLAYEAPADSAVGDYGWVRLYDYHAGRDRIHDATITALTSAYTGPCRQFVRTGHAAEPIVRLEAGHEAAAHG